MATASAPRPPPRIEGSSPAGDTGERGRQPPQDAARASAHRAANRLATAGLATALLSVAGAALLNSAASSAAASALLSVAAMFCLASAVVLQFLARRPVRANAIPSDTVHPLQLERARRRIHVGTEDEPGRIG